MKALTYEDWIQDPTPRVMWVWDADEEMKVQRKVVYVLKAGHCAYPVMVVTDECMYENYSHCAEIEKPRMRRMTNQELARWLREHPTREYKRDVCGYVYSFHTYSEHEASKKVVAGTLIREDYGEWKEPLVEEENK